VKRRGFLQALAAVVTVGPVLVETAEAAPAPPLAVPSHRVIEEHGTPNGPFDWDEELEEAQRAVVLAAIRNSPAVQAYMERRILEKLGLG
jgi:hypothetical protein